jgi:hypothetical protein
MPPLSVTTIDDAFVSARKSIYPRGPVSVTDDEKSFIKPIHEASFQCGDERQKLLFHRCTNVKESDKCRQRLLFIHVCRPVEGGQDILPGITPSCS